MAAENPIFLKDLVARHEHAGMPGLAAELGEQSDMDSVVLLLHDRLLAAGRDLGMEFKEMGFELEVRGSHGAGGELSMTDPNSGPVLARHLGDHLDQTTRGLFYYLAKVESCVDLARSALTQRGEDSAVLLAPYFEATGLSPDDPEGVQVSLQKLKLKRLADKMAERWGKEAKLKKIRPRLDAALKRPFLEEPNPEQVAALLMPFQGNDCVEVADMEGYRQAVGAAISTLYQVGAKLTPSSTLLRLSGLWPVFESAPVEERPLRERVGADLAAAFLSEEALRDRTARVCATTLSLQELRSLRHACFTTTYELSPEDAVTADTILTLKKRGVEDPEGFLGDKCDAGLRVL